jgi:hypothetical protein
MLELFFFFAYKMCSLVLNRIRVEVSKVVELQVSANEGWKRKGKKEMMQRCIKAMADKGQRGHLMHVLMCDVFVHCLSVRNGRAQVRLNNWTGSLASFL